MFFSLKICCRGEKERQNDVDGFLKTFQWHLACHDSTKTQRVVTSGVGIVLCVLQFFVLIRVFFFFFFFFFFSFFLFFFFFFADQQFRALPDLLEADCCK